MDEAGGIGVEPCGEFEDVVEADVASPSLHLAYEGPVQPGAFGEAFLAEVKLVASCADAFTESGGGG